MKCPNSCATTSSIKITKPIIIPNTIFIVTIVAQKSGRLVPDFAYVKFLAATIKSQQACRDLFAEATLAIVKLVEKLLAIFGFDGREVFVDKEELGIGGAPQLEPGNAFFAGGADD